MKDWVKTDRLKFKIGSMEWMNYFGLSIALIVLSLINLIFIFKTDNPEKVLVLMIIFITCLTIGVSTYFYQLNRLKYKSFKLDKELDDFKNNLKEILKNSE